MCYPAVLSIILLFGAKGITQSSERSSSFCSALCLSIEINKSLEAFKNGWNMHGIRTENNKSPLQLFHAGALRLQHSGLVAMDLFQPVDEEYGVDPDEPTLLQEVQ